MKKVFAALLFATLTLGLVACGSASSVAAPASSVPVAPSASVSTPVASVAAESAPAMDNTAAQPVADALRDASGIQNPIAIDEDELYYNMNITLDNIAGYAGYYTGVTGSSGTVLAVQAKDGMADTVKAELETYRATNADFLSNYPEFATAQSQAENGRIQANGNTVVLVIAGADIDYAAVDTAISDALK